MSETGKTWGSNRMIQEFSVGLLQNIYEWNKNMNHKNRTLIDRLVTRNQFATFCSNIRLISQQWYIWACTKTPVSLSEMNWWYQCSVFWTKPRMCSQQRTRLVSVLQFLQWLSKSGAAVKPSPPWLQSWFRHCVSGSGPVPICGGCGWVAQVKTAPGEPGPSWPACARTAQPSSTQHRSHNICCSCAACSGTTRSTSLLFS